MTIKHGDVFRHELAGPGGWGDPLLRDPGAVRDDVRNEIVGADRALNVYGVVVDRGTWSVDAQATSVQREKLRNARAWTKVPTVSRGPAADDLAGRSAA